MCVDGDWEHGEDICGDGGCIKAILTAGNGPRPAAGSRVSVEYTIRIGREVVDSTDLHDEPFEFVLGQRPSDAIGCWEEALPTMQVGEVARVTCAPEYAYGQRGAAPKIPSNATLDCEIRLLAVSDPAGERTALADQYKGTDSEEEVLTKYKADLESGETVNDFNLTRDGKPREVFEKDDPRMRAVTNRNQVVSGKAPTYWWTETERGIDVTIPVPLGTSAREIAFECRGQNLKVALADGETFKELLVGRLHGAVQAGQECWVLTEEGGQRVFHLTLRKQAPDDRIWATVLEMSD